MKLNVSKKVHYETGPNLTPLVDVVMVILIFLMMAGSFRGAEHFLTSNVPIVEKGLGDVKPKPGFVPDEPILVRVDPAGSGYVATAGNIRAADARSLTARLETLRDQLVKNGTPLEKIRVIISPGKMVRYDHLIQVYEAALNAKLQANFATSHD
jgi:biopolymer transport protein ExbD